MKVNIGKDSSLQPDACDTRKAEVTEPVCKRPRGLIHSVVSQGQRPIVFLTGSDRSSCVLPTGDSVPSELFSTPLQWGPCTACV